MASFDDITQLLNDWAEGDGSALEEVLPFVYDELSRIAAGYLHREREDHTLQPTALVNEAYLRLAGRHNVRWQDRKHFYAVAAQAMRRILVDHARGLRSAKRGRGKPLPIDAVAEPVVEIQIDPGLIDLDQALVRLQEVDPEAVRLVELRFFGGLSIEETADLMGRSRASVVRHWRVAKAWLYEELSRDPGPSPTVT